jgi:hypothetical protein
MKWVLIIVQLGYSSSGTGNTTYSCAPMPACLTGTIINASPPVNVVPTSKDRSQPMDRDSCFKAAETVKKAFPSAEVSCEVVQ